MPASPPLHVAFVWHMHQPYYKASSGGEFLLPWVRLHALKDYADMVDILADFPSVHQTFNLVPSLLEQLEEYASGDFRETHWDLTLKPAEDLDQPERTFVVELMCENSWHPRAQRHPRYLELARKREACLPLGIERCTGEFSVQELRDLQVWFNLAWFDPVYLHKEPLANLVARGRHFSEEDKVVLATEQESILRRTIPAYVEAEKREAIEVTTSPYFHPILPLLMNTDIARVARGEVTLPSRRFAHPEDAIEQIDLGLAKYEELFGHRARGMWCSEMSVGEDIIVPLADRGVHWTIADEEHLARSAGGSFTRDGAGRLHQPDRLYRPYRLEREGRALDIVFRDHALSDLIGFTYQSWGPRDAAANLLWHLRETRRELAEASSGPHLVTIALDGENAWEYYQDDGREFLRHLYQMLSEDDSLACVTVSEFLGEQPPRHELPWLHTGSWIYGDFSTWIGDPAHGPAWDQLHAARDNVAARRQKAPGGEPVRDSSDLDEAWHHILVAEGSDWFWWFGEHQQSNIDHLWDLNFRQHLQEAYRLAGVAPPLELFAPLLQGTPNLVHLHPSAPISPHVDGLLLPAEEWEGAGSYQTVGGTMQRAGARLLEELRYGAGAGGLHFLLRPGAGFQAGVEVSLYLGPTGNAGRPDAQATQEVTARSSGVWSSDAVPRGLPFEVLRALRVRPLEPRSLQVSLASQVAGEWGPRKPVEAAVWDEVVEITIPWPSLSLPRGTSRLDLAAAVTRQEQIVEVWPTTGSLRLELGALGLVDVGRSISEEA